MCGTESDKDKPTAAEVAEEVVDDFGGAIPATDCEPERNIHDAFPDCDD